MFFQHQYNLHSHISYRLHLGNISPINYFHLNCLKYLKQDFSLMDYLVLLYSSTLGCRLGLEVILQILHRLHQNHQFVVQIVDIGHHYHLVKYQIFIPPKLNF